MSERGTVDPTRQGNAPVDRPEELPSAKPVTPDQALAAVAGWIAGGMPLFGLHQISVALAAEATDRRTEIERIRAALPGVIACAHHEGIACNRHSIGWHPCCATRLRMVEAGLIPAPVRDDEPADPA